MMQAIPLIDPPVQAMTLADGRRLEWREYGRPDGRPVVYFHGGGGCSIEGGIFHREAADQNIRLIATSRPGAGGSTICPGRPAAAYADDLTELLGALDIGTFACFGESNGGMMTLAVAATMRSRVLGGVPINPTLPWFDPLARSVASRGAAIGYRMMTYLPRVVTRLAANSADRVRRQKAETPRREGAYNPVDLLGPPPGIEADVAEIQWRTMDRTDRQALLAELAWATVDWGFDYYAIPVRLDFFCGVYDAQAPFALVLADRNPDARFHHFAYGHNGFSHPDARRRIVATVAGYFGN